VTGRTALRRRVVPFAALVATASLTLAACGGNGNDHASSSGSSGSGSNAAVAKAPPVSPLTGLALKQDPKHPVLIVKIDNSANSAPQVGLGSADMVAEELVEGGITRLAAFFYTDPPTRVGPVRSMRATDIGVVRPLGAALVASGGAPVTVRRIKAAGIHAYTEGHAKGFSRDNSRAAPYNLFMDLRAFAPTVRAHKTPSPYLPFSAHAKLPPGHKAAALTATFSGGSSTSFTYQGGHYVNTDSNAAPGDRFTPDTVLVLRVKEGDAGYLDPAGNPVPEADFTGSGPAIVFHGGRMVHATWTKKGLGADVTLSARGSSLQLPPGKVWVELVPRNGGGGVSVRP
jgi:hypothetical protein